MSKSPAALSRKEYDVAVIGGGINGASAAQHLVAAGYSVLLVEKGDFGSGSSSRSSRLLHCGLRYLAPGRSIFDFLFHPTQFVAALRMAGQAMHARSEFVRTSSTRTRQMQFCFPVYKNGPYKNWQVDIAFRLLHALGPKDLPLDYRRVTPAHAATMPLVKQLRDFNQLKSLVIFREYQIDWPERVCVDTVLDAARLGADVRNYSVARIVARQNEEWIIELSANEDAGETVRVTAKAILNMAGIWIDDISRTVQPKAQRRILGTKGCHIVVKLPDECADIGIATLNTKQEPFYCIPWRGYHYFGPTETIYEGNKDSIYVTGEERAFLISEANRLLPGLRISDADVLLTWAGVRPLTYDENVPFGNRDRTVHDLSADGLPNVFAMTAGPVMSHRSAGRAMVDVISSRIKASGKASTPDYTPRNFPENQNSPLLLLDSAKFKLSDVKHAVREERAANLMDVLFRRVGASWECTLTENEIIRAADAIASELKWDASRKQKEIEKYKAEVKRLFDPKEGLRPVNSHLQ